MAHERDENAVNSARYAGFEPLRGAIRSNRQSGTSETARWLCATLSLGSTAFRTLPATSGKCRDSQTKAGRPANERRPTDGLRAGRLDHSHGYIGQRALYRAIPGRRGESDRWPCCSLEPPPCLGEGHSRACHPASEVPLVEPSHQPRLRSGPSKPSVCGPPELGRVKSCDALGDGRD